MIVMIQILILRGGEAYSDDTSAHTSTDYVKQAQPFMQAVLITMAILIVFH